MNSIKGIMLIGLILLLSITAHSNAIKIKVESVSFEGNTTFSSKRLERLMLTRSSKFLAKSFYYPEILNDDIENLSIFYQQNGYLDVSIDLPSVTIDTLNKSCEIKINISEGIQTDVGGISFFGNVAFADSILFAAIKLKKDEPFRRNLVQDGQLAILSLYAENGFLDASVKPDIKINSETKTGYVDFIINENKQFLIGDIKIDGTEKAKPKIITRELSFKKGEIIKYSRILESQRNLYLTGLFETVFVRPVSSHNDIASQKDILIEVKENERNEFNFLIGYGSEDKARTQVEFISRNFRGSSKKIRLGLKASFIRRSINGSFTEPRLFGTRWRIDINSMFEFLEQPGYDVSRLNSLFTIGRIFKKSVQMDFSFRYEDAHLRHIEVLEDIDNVEPRVRSFIVSLSYDKRDNLFDPHKGTFISLTNEIAGAFLKGNNTFLKSIMTGKYFYRLNNKTILASALEISIMGHLGSHKEISLSERFYTGGSNSLRGFEYQKVGPLDEEANPIGGNFRIVWNALEVRRSIYKVLGGVFFMDVGSVWINARDFNFSGFRVSAGPGLRLSTPIGILRLDYGINIDKKENESRGMIHFNMGHTF